MTLRTESGIEHTWRWFGPSDTVPLQHIRQAGATGVVTALHHIPNGEAWPVNEILERKEIIEKSGLRWAVVESVPVHEDIKRATGQAHKYLANYKQSLRNLASCGISIVCYNFMPLLDWTRTQLEWKLPDGSESLRFDAVDAAAFDAFILERPGVEKSWREDVLSEASKRFKGMTQDERDAVSKVILAGLPGTVDDLTLEEFRGLLTHYDEIDDTTLRNNYTAFLREVIPVAEELGMLLCIHPDDPPFPLFGLPKIASVASDFDAILSAYDSPANGITFCTGSLGANPANDLPAMLRRFAHRVHFLHFRNVKREPDGSFYEANHLAGDVNMAGVMQAAIEEVDRRAAAGITTKLPMRPDHGLRMLDDLHKSFYPGYSAVGRLRGLAELRGLELGLRYAKSK